MAVLHNLGIMPFCQLLNRASPQKWLKDIFHGAQQLSS